MVKLNKKKKGRRSGKHIQYNLARRSLKKKSKRKSKSKKILIGGGYLSKSNEYDNKATISFDISNCKNGPGKITFKSQDNMKELTNDDEKNFVLLKHRVLDEKTSTPSRKTPLYEAYFKIPKIIFSLCRQKSKGDKNNLKLTVQYQETGIKNSFDINHTCNQKSIFNKFADNFVKNQLETDANGLKDAFKNALENHTSYNDHISVFLEEHQEQLSEKTIENIKHNLDKGDEKEEKETETKKEKHIVKEECDETKQLLKGMSITINPDGTVQFNKSGENTRQSTNKMFNDVAMSIKNIGNDIAVIIGDGAEENVKAKANEENVEKDVKNAAEKKVTELVNSTNSTSSNEDNVKAAEEDKKAIEENVKDEAKKAVGTEIDSTSSNEENVEKNINDAAEKKVTEELVNVAAIKAVEQAVAVESVN